MEGICLSGHVVGGWAGPLVLHTDFVYRHFSLGFADTLIDHKVGVIGCGKGRFVGS